MTDTTSGSFMGIVLLCVVVFGLLILQGGYPIPSSGYCERPCVEVILR